MSRRPLRRGFDTAGLWEEEEITAAELQLKFDEERAKGFQGARAFMNLMAQYNFSIGHLQTCASKFLASHCLSLRATGKPFQSRL
jgi:hypothetical protein